MADDGTLDAATATDEDVSTALFGSDEPDQGDQPEGTEVDEQGDEPTLADIAAQLAELKRDNARLKRENAAARIARKSEKVAPAADGDAVAAAVEAAKAEARLDYGVKLARSEVKAALAPLMPADQLDGFVDDLNLARFIDDDGNVDVDEIEALRARQTKIIGRRPVAKVGHGRTGNGVKKTTADQFADTFRDILR